MKRNILPLVFVLLSSCDCKVCESFSNEGNADTSKYEYVERVMYRGPLMINGSLIYQPPIIWYEKVPKQKNKVREKQQDK